jgi:predicted component of viral defense system (DUF524 family)
MIIFLLSIYGFLDSSVKFGFRNFAYHGIICIQIAELYEFYVVFNIQWAKLACTILIFVL